MLTATVTRKQQERAKLNAHKGVLKKLLQFPVTPPVQVFMFVISIFNCNCNCQQFQIHTSQLKHSMVHSSTEAATYHAASRK
jgi:hypothetical protein